MPTPLVPTRRTFYYSDSILRAQTRHNGRILVGTNDQPLFVRTRQGWVEYPGSLPLKVRTRQGWMDAVT
jgi:hypothetical protein